MEGRDAYSGAVNACGVDDVDVETGPEEEEEGDWGVEELEELDPTTVGPFVEY